MKANRKALPVFLFSLFLCACEKNISPANSLPKKTLPLIFKKNPIPTTPLPKKETPPEIEKPTLKERRFSEQLFA